jgi:hypothetical protein
LSQKAVLPRRSLGAANKTLAVFLTGLQKNLIIDNKLKNVVEPVRAQGWDVDVFMDIVGIQPRPGKAWSPIQNEAMEDSVEGMASDLLSLFKKNLEKRGARLVHGVVQKTDYNIEDDLKAASNLSGLHRMYEYNPFNQHDHLKARTGQAVLKRFKALQTLMSIAAATREYDFVLVTRDTDLWLRELDLGHFAPVNDGPTVFTKGCKMYKGVNDKTFVFTGDASKAVLSRIYDNFFEERYSVLNKCKSAEQYWSRLIKKVHHVHSLPLQPSYIPTADAHWRSTNGSKEICVKIRYLCTWQLEAFVQAPMC